MARLQVPLPPLFANSVKQAVVEVMALIGDGVRSLHLVSCALTSFALVSVAEYTASDEPVWSIG